MTELGGLPGAPPPPARPEKKEAPTMNVGDTVLLEMNGDKWAFIKLKRDGYVTSFPECHRRRMCPTRACCAPRDGASGHLTLAPAAAAADHHLLRHPDSSRLTPSFPLLPLIQ
jgi:hypothetical protein